jgi:hypothetical protein
MAFAGYNARPWRIRARDSCPARLASEGFTKAVEPLFQDSVADQVFDKDDMITSGIMPLAVAVFNDAGEKMMFFEIDLRPAIKNYPGK